MGGAVASIVAGIIALVGATIWGVKHRREINLRIQTREIEARTAFEKAVAEFESSRRTLLKRGLLLSAEELEEHLAEVEAHLAVLRESRVD